MTKQVVTGLKDSVKLLFRAAASVPTRTSLPPLPSAPLAAPMSVDAAQKTRVFRRSGFITARDARKLVERFEGLGIPRCTNLLTDFEEYSSDQRAVHSVRYLQESGRFNHLFPGLRKRILSLANEANERENWGLALSSAALRVAEYHHYTRGGGLLAMDHYDKGSLVTVAVVLEAAKSGGVFETVESVELEGVEAEGGSGSDAGRGGEQVKTKAHIMMPGDALVFVSHKYHRVTRVEEGQRRVLVVELWSGVERTCGHRCDLMLGECHFDPNNK